MKILVITDSLGLPRNIPEIVYNNETWPSLLKQKYEVHQISIGGASVGRLFSQLGYVFWFDPDIYIIQSGIVDCAPRALTEMENEFFNKFYITRKILNLVLPKCSKFLRKYRHITYTPKNTFDDYVKLFKSSTSKEIFWIGIIPATKEYEIKVPGVQKSIYEFNTIIKNTFPDNFINMNNLPNEFLMTDFHHLNSKGHKYVFDLLDQKINKNNL